MNGESVCPQADTGGFHNACFMTQDVLTNNISEFSNRDFLSGEVILVDKPAGKSSFHVVYKIRKFAHVKKAGHAGTLDPAATGLMIICTGRKTKEIEKFQGLPKTYTGIITLGKVTPSMDAETPFSEENSIEGITEERILEARDSFLGDSFQIPPMYSALKVNGKRLYKYARKGKEVVRAPRHIHISSFEITRIDLPDISFSITCSKGTYIRVIADDLGKKLGCGAYLKQLRRTVIGDFRVSDAFTLEQFETAASSAGGMP